MKVIKFLCLTGMILFAHSSKSQDVNRTSFEIYLTEVYNAYLNGGWQDMKNYYAEKAIEIDPNGNVSNGFEVLEKNYAMFESMMEGKPKFTYKLTSYKMVKPDVAIIYWDAMDEITLKGGKPLKMEMTCSAVLSKNSGNWKIESTQLTPKVAFSTPSEDQESLMKLGKEAYAAFEARDAKRFSNNFTDDVIFISPNGEVAYGKESVEQMHVELFRLWANTKKVSAEVTSNTLRVLSPEVVLIHWIDKSSYNMDGNLVTENLAFSNTCVKRNGKWQSVALSMTPIIKKTTF